jgi:hypothetical protein
VKDKLAGGKDLLLRFSRKRIRFDCCLLFCRKRIRFGSRLLFAFLSRRPAGCRLFRIFLRICFRSGFLSSCRGILSGSISRRLILAGNVFRFRRLVRAFLCRVLGDFFVLFRNLLNFFGAFF